MVRYIGQSFDILGPVDGEAMLKRVELAGRTCYKSEGAIGGESHLAFARMIVRNQHFSVIEHVSMSVRLVTSRGVTHELVRHRMASFSQESTRYCNYAKDKHGNEITVIDRRPSFEHEADRLEWQGAMEEAERRYMNLVGRGVSPQVARGVLPIDLKTEIIVTANLREWRHVFELRTSEAAHPDIRTLMSDLLASFKREVPVIFDDIQ